MAFVIGNRKTLWHGVRMKSYSSLHVLNMNLFSIAGPSQSLAGHCRHEGNER